MLLTCCTLVHSQRSTACSDPGSHDGKASVHSLYWSGALPSKVDTLAWSMQPGKSASLIQLEGASTCAGGRVCMLSLSLQRWRWRNETSAHLCVVANVQRAVQGKDHTCESQRCVVSASLGFEPCVAYQSSKVHTPGPETRLQ